MRRICLYSLIQGIMTLSYGQTNSVHYEEIVIGCLNLTQIPDNIIIKDQKGFQDLYSHLSPHPNCSSYTLPEIDFNTKTLIGISADSGGCQEPEIKLDLLKEHGSCVFNLTIKSNGMCKALFMKRIWVVVENSDCKEFDFKTIITK